VSKAKSEPKFPRRELSVRCHGPGPRERGRGRSILPGAPIRWSAGSRRETTTGSSGRRLSRMPTVPLLFAQPILRFIVLSRQRIQPSRCSRTNRPTDAYKIGIRKFQDALTKFFRVESCGFHGRLHTKWPSFRQAQSMRKCECQGLVVPLSSDSEE
jgi:hypothetical protein